MAHTWESDQLANWRWGQIGHESNLQGYTYVCLNMVCLSGMSGQFELDVVKMMIARDVNLFRNTMLFICIL